MTKPYVKLEKDLKEALESYNYVFLMDEPGTGKSHTALKITSEMYKYIAFITNTHEINAELHLDYNLSTPYFVDMFGKDFDKISPKLQAKMGYPRCMCDFHNNPSYYLKKLNYLPDSWCSYPKGERTIEKLRNHCPDIFVCKHRKMIQAAIKSLKDKGINNNLVWLMVKAYLETTMIDTFLKVDKPAGVIDENILGLCFEQVDLNVKSIRSFYSLADRIVRANPDLREVWTDFSKILEKLDLYLFYHRQVNVDERRENISKLISDFLESFEIDVIVNWNNRFKSIVLENTKEIRGTYNIMGILIKILNENKKDIEIFKQNITIDKDNPSISLFISKVEHIRSIVKRFYKLIFTDALLPMVIKEITEVLQIGDDYNILHNKDLKSKFKEVRVYKLNKQRGLMSKNTLLNLEHTNLSNTFFKLIELSKQILEFEHNRSRDIGLIGSMKIFQSNLYATNIQKELESIIEKYKMDISFDHYGNIEGKNCYSNVDWIIAFGGYNTPQRIRKILSNIVSISMDKLEYLYGPGAIIQLAHRGRPLLRPYKVSAYFLTNEISGCFEQEEEFFGILEVEHRDLLNQIVRQGGATTNYVMQYLNLSRQSTLNLLNKLFTEGLVKQRLLETGNRGRRSWVWYV